MTRIVSYPDPRVGLLPLFPTLALSPPLGLATVFKMSLLVAMVAVLVACRAGLITGAVARSIHSWYRLWSSSWGWGPGSLVTVWLVCVW